MDIIFEKTLLYDFYGELLTEKQQEIYELYHLDDLSLSEISEQMGISRQGVHDTIKRCDKQLHKYEEKLRLVQKFVSNKHKINEINQLASLASDEQVVETKNMIENMNRIKKISNDILKDL